MYVEVLNISPCSITLEVLGTTERIFATKTGLYDICIDNNEIRFCGTGLQKQIRCTSADCIRYKSWENERSNATRQYRFRMNHSSD